MYAQRFSFGLTGLLFVISCLTSMSNNLYGRTWATVQSGSHGENVYAVQAMLIQRGYSLTYNGDFDGPTQTAVKNFQRAKGLVVDGIVGTNTWEKLVWTLHLNDKNVAVVVNALQRELVKHGYAVVVDGIFGDRTFEAVKRFQTSKGLLADGIVGPNTWAALTGR